MPEYKNPENTGNPIFSGFIFFYFTPFCRRKDEAEFVVLICNDFFKYSMMHTMIPMLAAPSPIFMVSIRIIK